jgi:hypothetical protein
MNVKDFFQLAGKEGKVMIVGEDGQVKGFFLTLDEYRKLINQESVATVSDQSDPIAEKANREILQAQLEEVISSSDGGTGPERVTDEPTAERIDAVLSRRAQELFPSSSTPEVVSSSDEEIKPNFDDI